MIAESRSKTGAEHVRGREGCNVCCSMLRCWRLIYTCSKRSKGKHKNPGCEDSLHDGAKVFVNAEYWYVNIAMFMQCWENVLSHVNNKGQWRCCVLHLPSCVKSGSGEVCCNGLFAMSLCWLLSASRSAFLYISEMFFPPTHCACGGHNLTHAGSSKDTFLPLLKVAWQKAATWFSTHRGFEISGVYPCNLAKVPEEVFSVSEAVWIHQLLTLTLQNCLTWNVIAVYQEVHQMDMQPPQCLIQRTALLNGLYFKILSLSLFWVSCHIAEKRQLQFRQTGKRLISQELGRKHTLQDKNPALILEPRKTTILTAC